ncbi:neuropeptide FF receptor 2-like [Stylophora pistillata]|uniref:neuropeptide FF receptor 2-like n=1 Tax=Stylophora pistillata TaxID=50429 RepID=UPI000C0521A2|nr:neuropeptide FF receptor 2-like [Stylophora pistillata]XP_022783612.1 neuropeptide FF receptor 2-like [Stylophora pistillata]XP_022783614.1 neuropeptide FF receptor 2-like [Stylophora pistillata]XP_022783615.1 neuropeptide FF receptor 2-like [Stylophora pistillata]XP_022783616.1 neuropeptide FF receptor 2-like [Stylophora pistillata]
MTNSTSSNTTESSPLPSGCTSRPFTPVEIWFQVSSFLVVVFFSIIGNTVVITIIKKKRSMHTPTNYFIVNLCAVNLLILLHNTLPDISGRIAPQLGFAVTGWPGKILCKLQAFLTSCTINSAILTLALIAADRFIAIFFPLKRLIHSRRAIQLIFLAWLIPALPGCIFLYVNDLVDYNGTVYCMEIWEPAIPRYYNTIYTTADFIMFYGLPLLEIIILYIAIIYRIWMRRIPGHVTTANQQVELKAKKNVLKMLITAVLTFALFWLPVKINVMVGLYSHSPCVLTPTRRFLALFLACGNCVINPIIFIVFSQDFRNGFKALCHCLPCFTSDVPRVHRQTMDVSGISFSVKHNGQSSLSLTKFKKIDD